MSNDVVFCPGSTPAKNPNQEYVNGVPQKPTQEPIQNLQPQFPPTQSVSDGVHKAVIRKVEVKYVEDMNHSGCSVATVLFDLEFLVNGHAVTETKVCKVTSEEARNVLCGELKLLGYDVKDRMDFEQIRGKLVGVDVFVKVETHRENGGKQKAVNSKSYTFVPFEKGKLFASVNPYVKW